MRTQMLTQLRTQMRTQVLTQVRTRMRTQWSIVQHSLRYEIATLFQPAHPTPSGQAPHNSKLKNGKVIPDLELKKKGRSSFEAAKMTPSLGGGV